MHHVFMTLAYFCLNRDAGQLAFGQDLICRDRTADLSSLFLNNIMYYVVLSQRTGLQALLEGGQYLVSAVLPY